MPDLNKGVFSVLESASQALTDTGDDSDRGYSPVFSKRALTEGAKQKMAKLMDLFEGKFGGQPIKPHFREAYLREAISTEDFPLIFGTILDRSMIANYRESPGVMRSLVRLRKNIRDFRTVERYRIDGGEGILDLIPKGGEYRADALSETQFTYQVAKRGKKFPLYWEDFINDAGDLGIFNELAPRLAKAARASEEKFITELLWEAGGFTTANISNGGGQAAVATTTLTVANLITAVEEFAAYTTPTDSNPIPPPDRIALVVPPALRLTAKQILNSVELRSDDAGTAMFGVSNPLSGEGISPVVNPWIPLVATTGTFGATSWALMRDPGEIAALEVGFLGSHPEPSVMLKTPDQSRLGGGALAFEEGDFENELIQLKVRHVFGGSFMDGRGIWASNGQ